MAAAAQKIIGPPGMGLWSYGGAPNGTPIPPNGQPGSGRIDCTHFIQMAIEQAGLSIPYASTSEINAQTGSGTYFVPDTNPRGQAGDVILVDAGAGPHSHAILEGTSPGTFYASNSSNGPTGNGGPQPMTANPWWNNRAAHGQYYAPCVKNQPAKTPSRGPTGGGGGGSIGGGGSPGAAGGGPSIWEIYWEWLMDQPIEVITTKIDYKE